LIFLSESLKSEYENFLDNGYCVFERDVALIDWINASLPAARRVVNDPKNAHWLRCGGTWFVGVNVLGNDALGRVENGLPLQGLAVEFIQSCITQTELDLDSGQLSVCYPGYPQPSEQEAESAYAYRLYRDAAHIDGIIKGGEHRYLTELHRYILAIPMVEFSNDASPFVVWEGSHKIIQQRLSSYLSDYPPDQWGNIPISDVYNAARKEVFEKCQRLELALTPGQAIVVYYMARLLGVPTQRQIKTGV